MALIELTPDMTGAEIVAVQNSNNAFLVPEPVEIPPPEIEDYSYDGFTNYIRYTSGAMIVWGRAVSVSEASTQVGAIYHGTLTAGSLNSGTFNFPKSFLDSYPYQPIVQASIYRVKGMAPGMMDTPGEVYNCWVRSVSGTTGSVLGTVNIASATQLYGPSYIGIAFTVQGRWK